jgi:hypothetical protein
MTKLYENQKLSVKTDWSIRMLMLGHWQAWPSQVIFLNLYECQKTMKLSECKITESMQIMNIISGMHGN